MHLLTSKRAATAVIMEIRLPLSCLGISTWTTGIVRRSQFGEVTTIASATPFSYRPFFGNLPCGSDCTTTGSDRPFGQHISLFDHISLLRLAQSWPPLDSLGNSSIYRLFCKELLGTCTVLAFPLCIMAEGTISGW